jgi:hypothetical protein
MNQLLNIPFTLRDIPSILEVKYASNESAYESGFDALDIPFDPDLCIGYPTVHAYIKNMTATGYRRYCGWIQLVKREYYSSEALVAPDEVNLSIDSLDPIHIYCAHGYPAEFYDAPCNNLNENIKGRWTAYTYLVDMPSRMNDNQLSFLAGFQWGYEEGKENGTLQVSMQGIKTISKKQWDEHIPFMQEEFPQYCYDDGSVLPCGNTAI